MPCTGVLAFVVDESGARQQRNLRSLVLVAVAQQRADPEHPLCGRCRLVTNPQ
ncbi:MAG TPA: hypothetical protein VN866_16185 [Mycobacterium sp.]|jgi:hypothetical protein|nr:hypothetical protein [Mycobacterium sp.]